MVNDHRQLDLIWYHLRCRPPRMSVGRYLNSFEVGNPGWAAPFPSWVLDCVSVKRELGCTKHSLLALLMAGIA